MGGGVGGTDRSYVPGPPAVPAPPSADPPADPSAACAPATSPPTGRGAAGGSPASQQPQQPAALLHPGRGAADSLPTVALMMPQPQQQPQLQLPDGHSQALPGLLSGLVAATAAVTPEQLQREQRVLGAWHLLQQQRLAAARASEAADQAVAELARARLVGTAAARRRGQSYHALVLCLALLVRCPACPTCRLPKHIYCLPARPPACLPACRS